MALKIFEALNLDHERADILLDLGRTYNLWKSGKSVLAVEYFNQSYLMYNATLGPCFLTASVANILSGSPLNLGFYNESINVSLETLHMQKQLKGENMTEQRVVTLHNLGHAYFKVGEHATGVEALNESVILSHDCSNHQMLKIIQHTYINIFHPIPFI